MTDTMRSDFEVDHPFGTGDATELDHRSVSLSPEPILAAVDNYRGVLVDLDRHVTVDATALASGRAVLVRRFVAAGLQAGGRVIVGVCNGAQVLAALAAILEIGASPLFLHYQVPPTELRKTPL